MRRHATSEAAFASLKDETLLLLRGTPGAPSPSLEWIAGAEVPGLVTVCADEARSPTIPPPDDDEPVDGSRRIITKMTIGATMLNHGKIRVRSRGRIRSFLRDATFEFNDECLVVAYLRTSEYVFHFLEEYWQQGFPRLHVRRVGMGR